MRFLLILFMVLFGMGVSAVNAQAVEVLPYGTDTFSVPIMNQSTFVIALVVVVALSVFSGGVIAWFAKRFEKMIPEETVLKLLTVAQNTTVASMRDFATRTPNQIDDLTVDVVEWIVKEFNKSKPLPMADDDDEPKG
jgi:hypothetical protein